jgi:integrase
LCFLTTKEIEDLGSAILIRQTETKTKVSRRFTIIQNEQNFLGLFRPPHTKHNRLFIFYKNGKCSTPPLGRNTFGSIPSKVATYLNLPDPKSYTGHCLRRSSATLLADSGGDITDLKRHGGWRSGTIAEGYIEDNIQNKLKIAEKIQGKRQHEEIAVPSTSSAFSNDYTEK